jgi:uncharacterized protein (DUF2147 family)
MARFKILVDYDDNSVEVNKVSIVGGFTMPSLEMTDLLTDVINDLEEKKSGSWNGYIADLQKDIDKQKKIRVGK